MVSTWKAERAGLAVAGIRTVGLSRRANGEKVGIISVSSKLLSPTFYDFSSLLFFPLLSHRLCFLVRPRIKNMRYIASEYVVVHTMSLRPGEGRARSKGLGHEDPFIRKELFECRTPHREDICFLLV